MSAGGKNMTLGEKLKNYRLAAGLTQDELADRYTSHAPLFQSGSAMKGIRG